MKALMDFVHKLGACFALDVDFTVEKTGRCFLLSKRLKGLVGGDFYYVGLYLGKVKNARFFPSFNLLSMLAKGKANKVVVDRKAAWLFICGRDVFRRGILSMQGSRRKGAYTLVMNEFGECLGFGSIAYGLDAEAGGKADVALKNISDIGDFLRRET